MIPSALDSCTVKLKLPWGAERKGACEKRTEEKARFVAQGRGPRAAGAKALSKQSWNDGKGVEDGHDDVHRHGILPPKKPSSEKWK